MRWLGNITDSIDMNLSKLQEIVENIGVLLSAVHGVAKSQTQLSYPIVGTPLLLPASPNLFFIK